MITLISSKIKFENDSWNILINTNNDVFFLMIFITIGSIILCINEKDHYLYYMIKYKNKSDFMKNLLLRKTFFSLIYSITIGISELIIYVILLDSSSLSLTSDLLIFVSQLINIFFYILWLSILQFYLFEFKNTAIYEIILLITVPILNIIIYNCYFNKIIIWMPIGKLMHNIHGINVISYHPYISYWILLILITYLIGKRLLKKKLI